MTKRQMTADWLLEEMRKFAAERNGNGLEDPETASYYQTCFNQLDARATKGELPSAWQPREDT